MVRALDTLCTTSAIGSARAVKTQEDMSLIMDATSVSMEMGFEPSARVDG